MSVPLIQKIRVGAYVIGKRVAGVKRYPLVLMLEPLFRCNLACPGCGKIDYPSEILKFAVDSNLSDHDAQVILRNSAGIGARKFHRFGALFVWHATAGCNPTLVFVAIALIFHVDLAGNRGDQTST